MARDYSKTNLAIWQDADWRALPWPAQSLYKMLWEHPDLSWCGVLDWRPAKFLGWAAGWERAQIELLADCLRARHFIVIDEETEECLVRSWARFDGITKHPKLSVTFARAFAGVGSNDIRGVLVNELHKLREKEPENVGWTRKEVLALFDQPRIDAKSLPVPEDPFRHGFRVRLEVGLEDVLAKVPEGQGVGLEVGFEGVSPLNQHQHLSTLHPALNAEVADAPGEEAKKTKRPTKLPKSWKPTPEHLERALAADLDLGKEADKFRAHAAEKGRTAVNWNAAFTRWLMNAEEYARRDRTPARSSASPPPVHLIEEPPPGLDAEQYDAWYRDQVAKRKAVGQ